MSADPDFFITKKLSKTEQGLSFFGPEALEEYKARNLQVINIVEELKREEFLADAGHIGSLIYLNRRIFPFSSVVMMPVAGSDVFIENGRRRTRPE